MKKLILAEDVDVIEPVEEVIETPETSDLQVGNLISSMIRTEWDSVDLYNAMLITLEDQNRSDIIDIVNNIISDHYIHIGQLEKALQLINVNAEDIEDGKDSIEDTVE